MFTTGRGDTGRDDSDAGSTTVTVTISSPSGPVGTTSLVTFLRLAVIALAISAARPAFVSVTVTSTMEVPAGADTETRLRKACGVTSRPNSSMTGSRTRALSARATKEETCRSA